MELISRKDAQARGLKLYFTGQPCKRGHISARLVRDAVCRECELARHGGYHARHRDRQLARMARNNERNREAIACAMRQRYAADPAPTRAKTAARRARELAAMPADYGELDELVMLEAAAACRRREAMTGYRWEVDHMVPLSRGGLHSWSNVQVIPAWLNRWKRNRLVLTALGEWTAFL